MSEKPFKLGITVGRFQVFHNGHRDMLDKALMLCERVGVFIGSSNESGTSKNPFSYETRADILRAVYGNRIEIYPLPDIGVGNNSRWGDYVMEQIKSRFNALPDLLISGKEERRVSWFSGPEGASIAELYIPKTIDISASRMREMLVNNDFNQWKQYTDERLWNRFSEMRETVLASAGNTETKSL